MFSCFFMWSESCEMSFYIVIYSRLGMLAFWEIVEKIVNISEICRFFSWGRWDWTWAQFCVDFETILGAVGRRSRKKCDPETLSKNGGKKVLQDFSEEFRHGGGRPLKLYNSIIKTIHIDPLSLHFVPQGHGGGYIYICICIYMHIWGLKKCKLFVFGSISDRFRNHGEV